MWLYMKVFFVSGFIKSRKAFYLSGEVRSFRASAPSVPVAMLLLAHVPRKGLTLSLPKCISEVARIGSIIIFHLSELWKVKLFILWDSIFLVRLQGKFEVSDHSLGLTK